MAGGSDEIFRLEGGHVGHGPRRWIEPSHHPTRRDRIGLVGVRVGGQEGVDYLLGHGFGREAKTEGDDIGIVPAAGASCRLGVHAESRPHPRHLIGGNRYPGAGPAAHHSTVGPAGCDRLADNPAHVRPGCRIGENLNGMPGFAQVIGDRSRKGAVLIGAVVPLAPGSHYCGANAGAANDPPSLG